MGRGANFSSGKFWLSQCTKPWLLIIDNADEPEMDVSELFPTGNLGHILTSTRNPNVIIHANSGSLRFRGMQPEEGIDLLLKSAYPLCQPNQSEPQKRSLAGMIAAELGYLAIAIDQAGATIRRNIYTLEKYLHSYLGYRHLLLSSESRIFASEANVITTWEIPFRQIAQRSSVEYQDAVTLMHIFAFLHFDTVPEAMFHAYWISNEVAESRFPSLLQLDSRHLEMGQDRLRQAISILCDHSIVEYDVRRKVCNLHPVVHRWSRTRIPGKSEVAFWLDCTAQLLTRCISPHLEASGHGFRRSLIPHVNSCVEFLRSNHSAFPQTARVTNQVERFASLYADNGMWRRAIHLQREIAGCRTRNLGKMHPDTLRAQRAVSKSLWNLFQVREALEIQKMLLFRQWWSRRALSDWIPLWRPNHIGYCLALDDLTQSLWLAGLRQLSRRTGERALGGFLSRLGPNDPLTLKAMFNLGRTYHHLGETDKSHSLLVAVVTRRKLLFGLDHPDTLMARNELGVSFYKRKCHLAAAERIVTRVTEARKRVLGEEHAYTLWSVNDLSKILSERGRPAEAVAQLESIIPIVERTLGHDHVGMNMTKGNLARAYVKCQRWSDAELLLGQMLELIGDDHPDWKETMHGYVHVQIQLGKVSQAQNNYQKLSQTLAQKGNIPNLSQERHLEHVEGQLRQRTN